VAIAVFRARCISCMPNATHACTDHVASRLIALLQQYCHMHNHSGQLQVQSCSSSEKIGWTMEDTFAVADQCTQLSAECPMSPDTASMMASQPSTIIHQALQEDVLWWLQYRSAHTCPSAYCNTCNHRQHTACTRILPTYCNVHTTDPAQFCEQTYQTSATQLLICCSISTATNRINRALPPTKERTLWLIATCDICIQSAARKSQYGDYIWQQQPSIQWQRCQHQ
jgi:hypothetical protein